MDDSGLVVQNTFLAVPVRTDNACRRSSSAPHGWKPCGKRGLILTTPPRRHSKDSSNAARDDHFEECLSMTDSSEAFNDCFSEQCDVTNENLFSEKGVEEPSENGLSFKTEGGDTMADSLADASEDWPAETWSFANTGDSFSDAGLDDANEEVFVDDQAWITEDCSIASGLGHSENISRKAKVTLSLFDSVDASEEVSADDQPFMVEDDSIAPTQDYSQDTSREGKVMLNLFDSVHPDTLGQGANCWNRLRCKAVPFASVACPPAELTSIIADTVQVIRDCDAVEEVKVRDGGMGGTTLIMIHPRNSSQEGACVFSEVMEFLLTATKQSENTYVLGYDAYPFQTLDDLSFSTTLAVLPESHRDSACWDMYEKGLCPRCGSCRWDHPSKMDMMQLIVTMTRDVAEVPQYQ